MRAGSSRTALAPLLLALAATSGCSEELGPEKFVTTSVTGRVVALGRGVGPGWIELIPVEGTTGLLAVARIGPDGVFKAERVPVGTVAVGLSRLPGTSVPTSVGALPVGLFQFNVTPVRLKIPNEPDAKVVVDLDVEAVKHIRTQEQVRRARGAEVE